MARYPLAKWRPIGAKTTDAQPIWPTAVVDHSDAGFVISLQGWWTNPDSESLSCHFHVDWAGNVEQYVDTTRRAVANVAANRFGISIECSNSPGYQSGRVSFADDAYSPEQVVSLIALHRWIEGEHSSVPRKLCTDSVHGFGWHMKFPSWTTPGHVCPGATRVQQLLTVVYPATFSTIPPLLKEDDDMTPAQAAELRAATADAAEAKRFAGQAVMYAAAAARDASWCAHGGIKAGVTEIYRDRLGRKPDAAGLRSWGDEASRSTWGQVDARIAASSEAKKHAAA